MCIRDSTETLVGIDAIIFFAMYAKDGRVPLVNKAMRTVGISLLGRLGLILVPIGVVIFPIGEPSLLRVGIHGLKVESPIVRDETFETFVMMSG